MFLMRFRHWGFLIMVFLIPLLLNPWGVDMYEMPKNTLFKLGTTLLGVLWLVDAVKQKKIRVFYSKKLALVCLLFVLILGLSWMSSLRPSVSFWGSYYKQGGLVNMLYYLLLFFIAADFLSSQTKRTQFLRVLSWSGCLVSVYALVQKLGLDFLPSSASDVFEGRSFSTLGNPSLLASFLLFPIGAELALFKKASRPASLIRLGLMILALLASRGRASILGLVVMGILLLLKHFKHRKKNLAAMGALALVAVTLFVGIYGSNTRSLESRFSIWKSSLRMIEDSPILGYGLENFAAVFPSYVTEDFYQYEDYMQSADRPHNEFLEQWIHLGFLGAGFHLFLIYFVLRTFWRSQDRLETFIGASLLALFVSNFFGFSLVTQYFFLMIFLAMLCMQSPHAWKLSAVHHLVFASFGGVLCLSLIFPLRFFVADLLFKQADKAFLSGESKTAAILVEKGQDWNPYFSELYTLSFKIDFGQALQEKSFLYLDAAAYDNEKAYDIDKGSLKTMTNFFQLYMAQGHTDEAEQVLVNLAEQVSVMPLLNQITGEFYFQQGRYAEAIREYERLLEILPEPTRVFWKNHPEFLKIQEHLEVAKQKI